MAITPLTTEAKVRELLSEVGADVRTDDLVDDDAYFARICLHATEWIFSHSIHHYDNDQAGGSEMLKNMATILSAHLLYMRRGDVGTSPFESEVERIQDYLDKLAKLEVQLPDAGARGPGQPGLSNVLIDDRFTLNKDRKDQNNSIGSYPGERGLFFPLSFGDGF